MLFFAFRFVVVVWFNFFVGFIWFCFEECIVLWCFACVVDLCLLYDCCMFFVCVRSLFVLVLITLSLLVPSVSLLLLSCGCCVFVV